jgi:hypothetical protein
MSRNRRLLMQMAGVIASPFERQQARQQRKIDRANRDLKRELALIDMIGRREKGDNTLKPMPFTEDKSGIR